MVLATLLLSSLSCAAGRELAPDAQGVQDDSGRLIAVFHPQKIISLVPAVTETICELGQCQRLIAVDRYSNWPADIGSLPKVGGMEDPNIEQIARLKPDLVFISDLSAVSERLNELHIQTFVVDARRYADIAHLISRLATLLQVPEAGKTLNQRVADGVRGLASRAKTVTQATQPRVYIEIDNTPYAAGEDSYLGELLSKLNASNIVPKRLGAFPRLDPEYVVRQNPDVIMLIDSTRDTLQGRPGWSTIKAIRRNQICTFDPGTRDLLSRPGPRVVEGMQALASCLSSFTASTPTPAKN